MQTNHVRTTIEVLYLLLMLRWEKTAPKENHQSQLDGRPARNTQTARLAFILNKIAAGAETRVFQALCSHTREREDSGPYVSKNSRRMKAPYPLLDGWCLEGCQNLGQKLDVTKALRYLGLSPQFVACVDEFVSGRTIQGFIPNKAEVEEMLRDATGQFEAFPTEIQVRTEKLAADLTAHLLVSDTAASQRQ